MPIIKSAKKRVRVAHKATIRNAKTRRSVRNAVKAFEASLSSNKTKAAEAHRQAQSELSKAAKKHVIHKNKLARKQRQLARAAKAAEVKLSATAKKTAPKAAAKPLTTKKPVKKAPAKKSTSKK